MPFFTPGDDPGPDFSALLRRVGLAPAVPTADVGDRLAITHGTTVVAIRYADGVVMAGDRRATAGNLISHRAIEKVFPADRHSGVAIAGAAGPAMEMVKLFQLQLEHYEKVEGSALSLEGKANQLGGMVRCNLPAAMQGLAVVPIFAGYDLRRRAGRLFQYDVTGGRYEETNYAATGSGSLHAGTVVKLGFREGLDRDDAVDLASPRCSRPPTRTPPPAGPTWSAASTRSSPPSPTTGFDRVPDDEIADRFVALLEVLTGREVGSSRLSETSTDTGSRRVDEHALLRRPRADDEGPGRLRPQGHRPWPVARRHPLRGRHR